MRLNMLIRPKNRAELIDAAIGKRKLDLIIQNVSLVNVFTSEIYEADIGIYQKHIAFTEVKGSYDKNLYTADTIIDGIGKYAVPGFIDPHMHIESSMMTPRNFAVAVVPLGVTTIVTDPHEVANVMGIEAVEYMIESSRDVPHRQLITAPSCVPAVPGLENSGAEFKSKEIQELLSKERVIGLGEIMDCAGVINSDKRITPIINEAMKRGGFLQGHAPMMQGPMLNGYLCGGPVSCHETIGADEALEKLRKGMVVDARESSMAWNLKEILKGIKGLNQVPANLTFCSDDREPFDILNQGHMDYIVRKAIEFGMDPIEAIKCTTINTARELGIENLGAIAPGYVADLSLLNSLNEVDVNDVIFEGKVVAKGGELVTPIEPKNYPIESINTISVDIDITEETFQIQAPIEKGVVKCNIIEYLDVNSHVTKCLEKNMAVENGVVRLDEDTEFQFVTIINRHKGNLNTSNGLVKGFGIKKGAYAASIGHDCHNITVIYSKPEEAVTAVKALIESKGGIATVMDNKLTGILELPIFGLLSPLPCKDLAEKIEHVKAAIIELGLEQNNNPLLRIAIITLIVYPEFKISDHGLVDTIKAKRIPLFPEYGLNI